MGAPCRCRPVPRRRLSQLGSFYWRSSLQLICDPGRLGRRWCLWLESPLLREEKGRKERLGREDDGMRARVADRECSRRTARGLFQRSSKAVPHFPLRERFACFRGVGVYWTATTVIRPRQVASYSSTGFGRPGGCEYMYMETWKQSTISQDPGSLAVVQK